MTSFSSLIEAEQAVSHLSDSEWRFLDCQFDLMDADAGLRQYSAAHIAGAVFADLNSDLSATPSADSGRHPLPAPEAFTEKLGLWGIDNNTQVVAYDGAAGVAASRLWWMLRWLGHDKVAVLNGGLKRWRELALPVNADAVSAPIKNFTPQLRKDFVVDTETILQQQSLGKLLLDARSGERYRGEVEPIDPVAGHIPGALNYFQGENLRESCLFKSREELIQQITRVIKNTEPQNIIHYCGSGVSACHNILAMEYIGLNGSKLYPGSWSEWIRDPQRPMAKG